MYIEFLDQLNSDDVKKVGGKIASLAEMIQSLKEENIKVPEGFATTSDAYREFLKHNQIQEKISELIDEYKSKQKPLEEVGKKIRQLFLKSEFPEAVAGDIRNAYQELSRQYNTKNVSIAARSSATAEDLPEASFAGQQESFLNVSGEDDVLEACKKCYASLFTDRAISYREDKGFDHMKVALSVGIHVLVAKDQPSAGVIFTLDTDSGFRDVVVITAAWGLGDNVVQGAVNPDQYSVYKPLLEDKDKIPIIEKSIGAKEKKLLFKGQGSETKNVETSQKERNAYVLGDDEILQLARWSCAIENHYDRPMDIEWAKDGKTGELYILQARPETVYSQKSKEVLKTYQLKTKGEILTQGLSIGQAIATGQVNVIKDSNQIDQFKDGSVLVTGMTDPDWVPIMKKASGIITDYGGRTSHAAIVSRELGIPAIVGTNNATELLEDDQDITLSCAEGDEGFVYEGILEYEEREVKVEDIPQTQTDIMMNIASPGAVYRWWQLPSDGIGLARMEFIINNHIKIHPLALVNYNDLKNKEAKKEIQKITLNYKDKSEYFVDRLALGIAKIASSQYPRPVIVRMSDFKSNEYANLIGGNEFEPEESNPMLGLRGASRYYSDLYRAGFALECQAIKRVRETIGLENVIIMIPFCRTIQEADRVLEVLAQNGLVRGENGLQVYVMIEIPSNVVLAEEFALRFDGFSIGTNDLTQLVLGISRDSSDLMHLFNEQDESIKRLIQDLIQKAHKHNTKVGICGQAPSDYPDFAIFLIENGIDSISLNPDSIIDTKEYIHKNEKKLNQLAS